MSRGAAWLLACLVLVPVLVWQLSREHRPMQPLPVLHTLGGDFTLDSTEGGRLSLSDLQGQVVLLNFGFTGCPDVCPTALARIRDVLGYFEEDRERLRSVFVTLDPEVDTVDRIGPYVRFFDPDFIGLTGSMAEIAAATEPFKVFYQREKLASASGYTINHSSHIYLIDSAGRVRATFAEGVPIGTIASSTRQLLAEPVALAWRSSK